MFDTYRDTQFTQYNKARKYFAEKPEQLIELEKYTCDILYRSLEIALPYIEKDYDEASYLYPFWQNYPPDNRGRAPRGDQFPWIEVGEHAVGDRLFKALEDKFELRSVGIPTGPDERYVLKSDRIKEITKGFTDSVWIFIDIKSVGPRDDHAHAVMSHNQISGSGEWKDPKQGLKNKIMKATGNRTSHDFYSSVPPIYVLSDGTILPVVNFVLKPVYGMLSLKDKDSRGQPLKRIELVSIPNGLLLEENPGYLQKYPKLLYPGKDAKQKNPLKIRARVDFRILQNIAEWRIKEILVK